jgi:hypothetical protein
LKKRFVVFDEVHPLPVPSRLLKIGADAFPHLRILATGSSTLEATTKFRDALTGRKRVVELVPVLYEELPAFGSQTSAKGCCGAVCRPCRRPASSRSRSRRRGSSCGRSSCPRCTRGCGLTARQSRPPPPGSRTGPAPACRLRCRCEWRDVPERAVRGGSEPQIRAGANTTPPRGLALSPATHPDELDACCRTAGIGLGHA